MRFGLAHSDSARCLGPARTRSSSPPPSPAS
uniref:Small nuclear ribonucleoprotein LSM1 n=1 Tax=Arundo donax TaxID=35708 RepID=A0A0A8Z4L1_ARUDO